MFDRRLVKYFDWGLLGLMIAVFTCGIVTLYSAVTAGVPTPQKMLCIKQLIWFGCGMGVMVVCFLIDYRVLERWALAIYIGCCGLLMSVLAFGQYIGGSRRWLMLGPVSLQPSELMKIAVIIMLARYYAKNSDPEGLTLRQLVVPMFYTLIPFALIVQQPDLGTAMLILFIAASVTFFVKLEKRTLVGLLTAGLVSVPLVWFLLKGYQKQRILTFLNPDRDPLGAGYHIIQSKIAIGSGMIFGKGYLEGTQNALSFLPERHTDFIFSVLAEEWGFIGAGSMLLLFLLFLFWSLNIAFRCRDAFGTILVVGITSMMFWQIFVNIGMVMGLMPVVGLPLPFVSYGGSSTLTMMICVGLLLNVSMRRFMFE